MANDRRRTIPSIPHCYPTRQNTHLHKNNPSGGACVVVWVGVGWRSLSNNF
ncbi:hypothetical protein [Anabaena sp. CCY 0017]|uniref:hypothetical protein n=1 Tax=Anabaena sp. CCY 0017 TaxID=3103866 RepID=UPI0039C6A08E